MDIALETINDWGIEFLKMLPKLIIGAIILVLGFFIAKRVKKFLRNKTSRYFPTKTLANLTISLVYTIIILIFVFIVLQIIGFDGAIDKALAGAGVLTLALSFAFQDIAANFISGIFLAFRKPFMVDELIKVKDIEGFVIQITLRDTEVRTYQGQIITIPNKVIFESPVTNYTRMGMRRADVFGHAQKMNDLRKVKKVALEALNNVPGIMPEKTNFFFKQVTQDDIIYNAEIWINSGNFDDFKNFMSNGIIILNEAFQANDITVPNDEYFIDFNENGERVISELHKN